MRNRKEEALQVLEDLIEQTKNMSQEEFDKQDAKTNYSSLTQVTVQDIKGGRIEIVRLDKYSDTTYIANWCGGFNKRFDEIIVPFNRKAYIGDYIIKQLETDYRDTTITVLSQKEYEKFDRMFL